MRRRKLTNDIRGGSIFGKDDIFVKTKLLLKMINKPWGKFLAFYVTKTEMELFREYERTGRPLGGDSFLEKMEFLLKCKFKPQKSGPKKENKS